MNYESNTSFNIQQHAHPLLTYLAPRRRALTQSWRAHIVFPINPIIHVILQRLASLSPLLFLPSCFLLGYCRMKAKCFQKDSLAFGELPCSFHIPMNLPCHSPTKYILSFASALFTSYPLSLKLCLLSSCPFPYLFTWDLLFQCIVFSFEDIPSGSFP